MDIGGFGQDQAGPPSLTLELDLQADDFQAEWKRCDLLANYIGEYAAYQFAQREWAENLISTVANELIETAVRLSPAGAALKLHCQQFADQLLLEAKHHVRRETLQPYAAFLNALCGQSREAHEFYYGLLTASEPEALAFNQLGLAMLVHDFGARLTARLDEAEGSIQMRVLIPTHELAL